MASKYHITKDGRRARKGLYYYMNRAKKRGTSKPGKGTVSDEALKASAKTAKKKSGGAWTRKEGQNPTGGLNAKGRASLSAKGPNIKAPVTSDNPKGKAKARKKSFCARMKGMRKRQKASNNTGKDRLSLSLKKWKCKKGGTCGKSMYETGGFLEPAIENIFE